MNKSQDGNEPIGSNLVVFIYYTFFAWEKEIGNV